MTETIVVVVLAFICVAQAVEKFFFTAKMLKQLDDAIKASMSRNINEYLVATKQPGKQTILPEETDEVDLEDATPEQFDKFIKNELK